jgi:hypothetical protein
MPAALTSSNLADMPMEQVILPLGVGFIASEFQTAVIYFVGIRLIGHSATGRWVGNVAAGKKYRPRPQVKYMPKQYRYRQPDNDTSHPVWRSKVVEVSPRLFEALQSRSHNREADSKSVRWFRNCRQCHSLLSFSRLNHDILRL